MNFNLLPALRSNECSKVAKEQITFSQWPLPDATSDVRRGSFNRVDDAADICRKHGGDYATSAESGESGHQRMTGLGLTLSTRHDKTRQDGTKQDMTRRDRTRPTRRDRTRQDGAQQDATRRDRQDMTQPDATRPNRTGRDMTGLDVTGRDKPWLDSTDKT